MDVNLILSTAVVGGLVFIVATVAGAFKPPPDPDYEGGIGDEITEDEEGNPIIVPKPPPKEKTTQRLDNFCDTDSQCSVTGRYGGRGANFLDRIHCDKGRCQHDRPTGFLGIWDPPSRCRTPFGAQCPVSGEEHTIRTKIQREGEYEPGHKPLLAGSGVSQDLITSSHIYDPRENRR